MQPSLSFRHRLIAALIVAVCLFWAATYTYQAASDPFGGDETSLFIQPLFILLLAVSAIWGIVEATTFMLSIERQSPDDQATFGASGLADYRRLAVVLSLPLMVILVWLLGFVFASATYVTALSWNLGERRKPLLLAMASVAVAMVWLLFGKLLGPSLPLWPTWLK